MKLPRPIASHVVWGLALALLIGIGLGLRLQSAGLAGLAASRAERSAIVGLRAVTEIVEAGGPMRPWMTVEGLYIAAPSKHKEEAYEFVKYVTDLPAAKIMALEGRQTPANGAVYDDPQVKADDQLAAFREQVSVAVPMPNRPEMAMVWSPATTAMNVITKKTATPKNAMDQAQKEVTERVAALLK